MILKYLRHDVKLISQARHTFSQPVKKRTQAPKHNKEKPDKFDPKNIDYSKIPEDLRKGVKAYVQARNMQVSSQAQLQSMALKQVIIEERQKFLTTLEQVGSTSAPKIQPQSTNGTTKKPQESFYDLMKAIKFNSLVANSMLAINLTGYLALNGLNKHEFLGFFFGLALNPSVICLAGLTIGFNAASWVIIHALHLQTKDPIDLTPEKISLTGCSSIMYMQALSILAQTGLLCYYLMQPDQFANYWYLVGAYGLAAFQTNVSVLRATGGFRYDVFSKLLITQASVGMLLLAMVYSFFSKIDDQGTQKGNEIEYQERALLAHGYKRFKEEFKEKKIAVVKGQAINQLINQELK